MIFLDLNSFLKKVRTESCITAISASFLLSITLCFFGPATLYYTNILEYSYTFSDVLPYLIGLTIILGVFLTIISFAFKEKTHLKIICIIFALGLLFYVQGNILVWYYGPLDGREIIWNNYLINGLIDSLIWISIITLSFLKSDQIYKFIPGICLFLLVIQTAGFLALVHFAPDEPSWKSYSFTNESKFEFSKNTNVIIIILDTFQSDVFQEIINENHDYINMFEGFTYYRNAVGGFPTTVGSVPLILTGNYYNNSEPFDTFVQTSYESSSLPKILKENGYIVDIYGTPRLIYPNEDLETNVGTNSFSYFNMIPLIQLTAFRNLPHFLKEATFTLLNIQSIHLASSDSSELSSIKIIQQTIRINETRTFKFYHLKGPHPPFRLNETLQYEKLPDNRSGYKEQSKASLRIVDDFLATLKENGIYNCSMIIVIGDHGMQNNKYGINTSQLNYSGSFSSTPQKIISAGIPLILIKPFNSTSKLKTSDAPVSLADIPKTVATELDLPNNFPGVSILNINKTSQRERRYNYFDSTYHKIWDAYFPAIHEYSIQNFSWFGDSWQPTYRVYTPNGLEIQYPPEYEIGTTKNFTNKGILNDYLISGWATEGEYPWSTGKTATLAFSMNKSDSPLFLHLPMYPFIIENKSEKQRVIININTHEIGNLSLTEKTFNEAVFFIPQEYLNEKFQYITFSLPDAISPTDLGIYDDARELGVALSTFNITEIKSPQISYADGWYSPENWSGTQIRWMTNLSVIHIYSSKNTTIHLDAKLVSFHRPRILEITSQNQIVSRLTVPSEGIDITIPLVLMNGDNTFNLLSSDRCEKPIDIPTLKNYDTRCISIAFQNVTAS